MSKNMHAKTTRRPGSGDALRTVRKPLSASRIDRKKKYAPLMIPLLACLVLTPATAGAEEFAPPNIGERGYTGEGVKFECWGVSRPDLNPDGNYAYYVQDVDGIQDVCGWHNTVSTDEGDTSADFHKAVIGGGVTIRNAYGGYSTNGAANKNVLIVNSGTISGNAVGGYAHESANAFGNKVFIYGGNFTSEDGKKSVSGGQGKTAYDNVVFIYGGDFTALITGATVMADDGEAKNNTVVLAGNFSGAPGIYGGDNGDNYTGVDLVTGNTLYLSGANTATKVQNFETIHIGKIINDQGNPVNVPATWGTPVLKLTGTGLEENKTTAAAIKKAKIDASTLTFTDPETIANGATMNLIACTGTGTINATLVKDTTAVQEYTVTPVTGVTIDAAFQGQLSIQDNKALVCTAEQRAKVLTFDADIPWSTTTPYYDLSGKFTFDDSTEIDAKNLTFSGLGCAAKGDVMTLLANTAGITDKHITQPIKSSYEYTGYSPVSGVTMNGAVTGEVAAANDNVTFMVTANNPAKLSFGDVEWKDSGALLDHTTTLSNLSFAGAAVDTSNIRFVNIQSLNASKEMTLVKDFLKDNESYTGTITGAKYKVGTTVEGEGFASLADTDGDEKANDLVFTALKGTAQEQTHNTLMGAEVGMAALSSGNDFIGAATEGLSLAANTGADGVASFAQMGGGSISQETGSHVDVRTWNAIIGLGHKNEKPRGTMEYGAFFEYGTGNYTTYNDGSQRGDGSTRYTGGGLLAKYTAKNNVYVEGSFRAGSIHDDARNVMIDGYGNPYSYETNAPYFGFHFGVGKEIALSGGNSIDVYGKYFFNRKNGVSFDAGGQFDLDAVASSVIRVGSRYTMKREKWNFYGGLAYEHELDGKATGTAGGEAIRAAETKGGSVRAELGATMMSDKNSPWTLDFNISGFAGKKQGFIGGVSVGLMF